MADKEKEQGLIGSIDDEFDIGEVKNRRMKRIFIFVGALIIIAAIVIILVLVLKDSGKNKDDSNSGEKQDSKYDILMKESDFIIPKSTTKKNSINTTKRK